MDNINKDTLIKIISNHNYCSRLFIFFNNDCIELKRN